MSAKQKQKAKQSKVVARTVRPPTKRKVRESARPRCSYIFPEHGHGHQQCTREEGHPPGMHWCGWTGKKDS